MLSKSVTIALYDSGAWPEDNVRAAVVALNREPLTMLRCVKPDLYPFPHVVFVLNSEDELTTRWRISEIAKSCAAHDIVLAEIDVPDEIAQTLLQDFNSQYNYGAQTPLSCWDFEDVRTVLAGQLLRKRVLSGVDQAAGDDASVIATSIAMKVAGLTGDADWGASSQKLTGVLSITAVSQSASDWIETMKQVVTQIRTRLPEKSKPYFLPSIVYAPNLTIDEVRVSIMAVGSW